jgi:hypothetical protein
MDKTFSSETLGERVKEVVSKEKEDLGEIMLTHAPGERTPGVHGPGGALPHHQKRV